MPGTGDDKDKKDEKKAASPFGISISSSKPLTEATLGVLNARYEEILGSYNALAMRNIIAAKDCLTELDNIDKLLKAGKEPHEATLLALTTKAAALGKLAAQRPKPNTVWVEDAKDAKDSKRVIKTPFSGTDSATWDILPISYCEAQVEVLLAEGQHAALKRALQSGDATNNSALGGARVSVAYHYHTNSGSGGIAFYYKHLGSNQVQPTVYDWASSRSANSYQWKNAKVTTSAPPPLKG